MRQCRIIAIANQKGGTAKSTTSCNLSNALALAGYRVLCVDMDPQANYTMSFGIERPNELGMTMHNIMAATMKKEYDMNEEDDEQLPDKSEYIIHGAKLDIIPSNINLSVTEMNLRNELGSEYILSGLLEPLRSEYDYMVIDTSPSIGKLTINALAACDSVIIPVSPQLWSATGLHDFLQTILKIKRKINPRIVIEGILLTICDERTRLFRDTKALLDAFCADKIRIFDTHIPSTVRIGEANYSSASILEFDSKSKAAIAYNEFAKEVVGYAHS